MYIHLHIFKKLHFLYYFFDFLKICYNVVVRKKRGVQKIMKNIKFFKYKDTQGFENLLSSYEYKLEDVKGFKFIEKKQYQGNTLKLYFICMKDAEEICFTVVDFKSFNEYHQARLGFKGNKLLE